MKKIKLEIIGLSFSQTQSGAYALVLGEEIGKRRLPIIIGGGIRTPEKAYENCNAGADIIVVGNAIEKDTSLIRDISFAIRSASLETSR